MLAALVVLLIAGFYLVPQLKGAGLTLGEVTGAPYWVGVVAVGVADQVADEQRLVHHQAVHWMPSSQTDEITLGAARRSSNP